MFCSDPCLGTGRAEEEVRGGCIASHGTRSDHSAALKCPLLPRVQQHSESQAHRHLP